MCIYTALNVTCAITQDCKLYCLYFFSMTLEISAKVYSALNDQSKKKFYSTFDFILNFKVSFPSRIKYQSNFFFIHPRQFSKYMVLYDNNIEDIVMIQVEI